MEEEIDMSIKFDIQRKNRKEKKNKKKKIRFGWFTIIRYGWFTVIYYVPAIERL